MGTAHVPEWLARASYPTLSYYAQQQYGGAAAYAAGMSVWTDNVHLAFGGVEC